MYDLSIPTASLGKMGLINQFNVTITSLMHHMHASGPLTETTYGGRQRKYFGVKIRYIGV